MASASPVRFIARPAAAATVATALAASSIASARDHTEAASKEASVVAKSDERSPVLAIAALALIAFVILSSDKKADANTMQKASANRRNSAADDYDDYDEDTAKPLLPHRTSMTGRDVDWTVLMAPVLIMGAIVAFLKTGKMPENLEHTIKRIIEYDLAALFLTVAYGHYIINVENSHMNSEERYFDAMFRVGGFVGSWWLARKLLEK